MTSSQEVADGDRKFRLKVDLVQGWVRAPPLASLGTGKRGKIYLIIKHVLPKVLFIKTTFLSK
jgi:hypothetical protein